jgi:hypothetical protein
MRRGQTVLARHIPVRAWIADLTVSPAVRAFDLVVARYLDRDCSRHSRPACGRRVVINKHFEAQRRHDATNVRRSFASRQSCANG